MLFGVMVAGAASAADIHDKAGTRAFSSLKIGIGAAAIGMGETGAGVADDAYATYWNVAGLANVRRSQIALMNNEWLLDLRQNFLSYAQPVGTKAGAAVFVTFLDYGELVGRDDEGKKTGTFRPYDLTVGAGTGFRVNEDLAVGVLAKFLRQQIDEASSQGVAVDLGLRYDVPESPLSLGLAVQHLGPSLKFDAEGFSLPTTVRVGAAYRLVGDGTVFALDVTVPADNDLRLGVGIAQELLGTIILRGGYRYEWGGNDLGGASGVTAGFGVRFEGLLLDYAFVSYGDLGPTNRVSLSLRF
jgi:hypothetical protein